MIFTLGMLALVFLAVLAGLIAVSCSGEGDSESRVEDDILYGHNLSKWYYLGHAIISFTGTSECVVHFFESKDGSKREYKLVSNSKYEDEDYYTKRHNYVSRFLIPWKAKQSNIWSLVQHPSDWSKDYLKKKGFTWSTKKKWWVQDESDDIQISEGFDPSLTFGEVVESEDDGCVVGG